MTPEQFAQQLDLIKQAAEQSGWIAGLFAVIVLGGFTLLGWAVKQLWHDHRELHKYVRETMATVISRNAIAIERLATVFEQKACPLEATHDIRRIADEVTTEQ